MKPDPIKDILDRAQYDLLPIISGCLMGVILLSVIRDLFTDQTTVRLWVIGYYIISVALTAAVWLAWQTGKVKPRWSHLLGILCLAGILLNPTVQAARGIALGPMYMAATLFGAALTVLSLRVLVIAQLAAIVIWIIIANNVYQAAQLYPVLIMNILAAGLGVVTLRKRIGTIRKIFRLESRVEALESILPMCSGCKKTRDEEGQWHSVESYLEAKEEGLLVSHGLCPDCKQELYGDYLRQRQEKSID